MQADKDWLLFCAKETSCLQGKKCADNNKGSVYGKVTH